MPFAGTVTALWSLFTEMLYDCHTPPPHTHTPETNVISSFNNAPVLKMIHGFGYCNGFIAVYYDTLAKWVT